MSTIELTGSNAGLPPRAKQVGTGLTVGIVSTYPPTACGLATFSRALVGGLQEIGVTSIRVVSVAGDDSDVMSDPLVTTAWHPHDRLSLNTAVRSLNLCDVVMIQHEFGIFGGDDGAEVLELMERVKSPTIVTLHTIPLTPTVGQRRVLERVVKLSTAAVTMTRVAGDRLRALYRVDDSKLFTIPHGATLPPQFAPTSADPPMLLTWGLLGPGKGIEHVIEALALVKQSGFDFRYVVSGRTHPKVLANQGEAYRNSLIDLTVKHGIEKNIIFDSTYKPLSALLDTVCAATCVVLPYESMEQTTSGVLVDAIAAGKPVISTPFPHAIELLHNGAGILVPSRDPRSMAMAISRVVSDPMLVENMRQRAVALAPMHSWTSVAESMKRLAANINSSKLGAA